MMVENNINEESSFIKVFGNTPINRLWDFIITSRGVFDYSMTEISETAGIAWNTLKEIFPHFVDRGIVRETRKVGRATMYELDESHPEAKFMIVLQMAIAMVFVRGGDFDIKITKKDNSDSMDFEVPESIRETEAVVC